MALLILEVTCHLLLTSSQHIKCTMLFFHVSAKILVAVLPILLCLHLNDCMSQIFPITPSCSRPKNRILSHCQGQFHRGPIAPGRFRDQGNEVDRREGFHMIAVKKFWCAGGSEMSRTPSGTEHPGDCRLARPTQFAETSKKCSNLTISHHSHQYLDPPANILTLPFLINIIRSVSTLKNQVCILLVWI